MDVFSAVVRIVAHEFIEPSVSQDNLRGSCDTAEADGEEHSGGNISEDLRECSDQDAETYQQ